MPSKLPSAGWLSDEEAEVLGGMARGALVLEVGAYAGRSTVAIAKTARHVVSVDHHRGSDEHQVGRSHFDQSFVDPITGEFTTYAAFVSSLKTFGVLKKVTILIGSSDMLWILKPGLFDLAFVDGGHDFATVRSDARLTHELVRSGGAVVFHDFGDPGFPGVTMAALDVAEGRKLEQPAGTLGVLWV